MKNKFTPQGVCSQQIEFDIEEGRVRNVKFTAGCNGNLKAISSLVEGMKAEDVIKRVKGIHCGMRTTSCGDQLALALEAALAPK